MRDSDSVYEPMYGGAGSLRRLCRRVRSSRVVTTLPRVGLLHDWLLDRHLAAETGMSIYDEMTRSYDGIERILTDRDS